jgi:hypothetical protein
LTPGVPGALRRAPTVELLEPPIGIDDLRSVNLLNNIAERRRGIRRRLGSQRRPFSLLGIARQTPGVDPDFRPTDAMARSLSLPSTLLTATYFFVFVGSSARFT